MEKNTNDESGDTVELITKKLKDIRPYARNPRRNEKAVDAVAESIKQCGYVAPIIVDENGVILAGHTRYKSLQKLGYKEAQVLIKEGLTDEQKRKYRLLDNKTGELADWDFELLSEELVDLDFEDLDLDWGEEVESTLPIAEDDDHTNNAKMNYISFGQIKIPASDDEIDELEKVYYEYCETEGTNIGFGLFLAQNAESR